MPRRLELMVRVDAKGHLAKSVRSQIASYLHLYCLEEVRITLGPKCRSTAANRYYWGRVIAPIRLALLESGLAHSAGAIHEVFKRRYLDVTTEIVFGEEVARYTTTRLDSTEFHYFIESIKQDEEVVALAVVFSEGDTADFRSYAIAEPA